MVLLISPIFFLALALKHNLYHKIEILSTI